MDTSARETQPNPTSEKPADPALSSTTPMMRQWNRVKAQHPDALLLFRMGDFYEMFGDDAVVVARELEISLTARSKDPDAVPMCGVPYHAAERYIAQLLSKGYRCAVCDQVEDPKYARGLVKREVTRVLSPGTLLEDSFLQSVGAAKGNNFLAALCADAGMKTFGLALLDISTGEFLSGHVEAVDNGREACAPASTSSTLSASNFQRRSLRGCAGRDAGRRRQLGALGAVARRVAAL
jgi:DNA mismatch repair protein MutS